MSRLHERVEHPLAARRFDAEEPGRLGQRELQPWHLTELRGDASAQLCAYAAVRSSKLLAVAAVATGAFCVGVAVCGLSVPAFFVRLVSELNPGDQQTMFLRYRGLAAGPESIFFAGRFVLSGDHRCCLCVQLLGGKP